MFFSVLPFHHIIPPPSSFLLCIYPACLPLPSLTSDGANGRPTGPSFPPSFLFSCPYFFALPPFLPLFLPSSFLHLTSFLPSVLHLPVFLPSFVSSSSFLTSFIFRPSFLFSILPSSYLLTSILPSFLPSFIFIPCFIFLPSPALLHLLSFLPSFLHGPSFLRSDSLSSLLSRPTKPVVTQQRYSDIGSLHPTLLKVQNSQSVGIFEQEIISQ